MGPRSSLVQVMPCLLQPNHYQHQCWLVINLILWNKHVQKLNQHEKMHWKMSPAKYSPQLKGLSALISRSWSYISGLWMADLTVVQTFQEHVKETERGVVNGVQESLNELMTMLEFAMVLIASRNETFGILAVISFGFICIGGLFFLYHVIRKVGRGTNRHKDDDKIEKNSRSLIFSVVWHGNIVFDIFFKKKPDW